MTWKAREFSIQNDIYASAGRLTAAGSVTGIVNPGGWDGIEYGSGIEKGELLAVETSVAIVDKDSSLIEMLETYDPRGSVAEIDWAADGLVVGDWEPLFRGIFEDWQRDGIITRLILKTDDSVLRTLVPSGVFSRVEWASANEGTIFGTHMPLVLGIHDAYLLTARGMLPATNIRYDKDNGFWWLASVGNLTDIRKVYFDGLKIPDASWTIRRGVFGGNNMTVIDITAGLEPEPGVIVTFDCEGPDANGLSVGPAITGPVQELRAVLEEFVYRNAPLAAWRGDDPIIDDTSWDATAAFFDARGYDSGRQWGLDQSAESGAEIIQSFLDAYPFTRVHWTPLGTIALVVIDPDDVDPDPTAHFDLAAFNEGGEVPFSPGDRREVYTHLSQPYMFSGAEQKFMNAYEAHDVAALPEKVRLSIDNPWSQTRFNND